MMEEKKGLTKAERKQIKLQKNQEWIHNYRSNGIEQDDLNRQYSRYYQIQLASCFHLQEKNKGENASPEWEEFVKMMKQPLPVTFRISERLSPSYSGKIYDWIMKQFPHTQKLYTEHDMMEANISSIPWCPSTYQFSIDNHTLLNQKSLERFNQFLTQECQIGHIIRQELVSMIPVLFLDAHYSHTVLDCCAAPGSKTEQILASMEKSRRNQNSSSSGCLVANDTDQKRIHELIRKFSPFPSSQLLVTNMNGEILSTYFHQSVNSPPTAASLEIFDRILCDVPCSGDGTFRKSPHLWRLFRPRTAISFHLIQRQILLQALLHLKPGGRLVYSTCSLNPIEDEAVVASVLADYGIDSMTLVDVSQSSTLHTLKARPGLSNWRSDLEIFMIEESEEARKETLKRLPELPDSIHVPSEVEQYHLERCLRILPQDQNTGGFFVAVIEKLRSFPEKQVHRQWKAASDKVKKLSSGAKDGVKDATKQSSSLIIGSSTMAANSGTAVSAITSLKAMKEIGFNPKPLLPSSSRLTNNPSDQRFIELSSFAPEIYQRVRSLFPLIPASHSQPVFVVDTKIDDSIMPLLDVYLICQRFPVHSYGCRVFSFDFQKPSASSNLSKIHWNPHFYQSFHGMSDNSFEFPTLEVSKLEEFQDFLQQQIQVHQKALNRDQSDRNEKDLFVTFGFHIPQSSEEFESTVCYLLSERTHSQTNNTSTVEKKPTSLLFDSWRKPQATPKISSTGGMTEVFEAKTNHLFINWAFDNRGSVFGGNNECLLRVMLRLSEVEDQLGESQQQPLGKRRLSKAERKALSKKSRVEISPGAVKSISVEEITAISKSEKASNRHLNEDSVFQLFYHARLENDKISFRLLDRVEYLSTISEYL